MNRVLIGSFVAARRSDSRATASVTPSTSKSTFAGRITATQDSSGPLPFPIRVSSGFLVNDFCGKTRIHILPWRFILRAMATRADSICLVSSQQRSRACKPYSPNATVWPREAVPARLPRCILRYLTLSGINGINQSSVFGLQFPARLCAVIGPSNSGSDWFGALFLLLRLVLLGLAFTNPAFDAELSIHGFGFGKTVIDVCAERVQRNTAPVIL